MIEGNGAGWAPGRGEYLFPVDPSDRPVVCDNGDAHPPIEDARVRSNNLRRIGLLGIATVTFAVLAACSGRPAATTTTTTNTSTTAPGGQKFVTDMCAQSADLCGFHGPEAQVEIRYGQVICDGLRQGHGGTNAIRAAVEAQTIIAPKAGANAPNSVTTVVLAARDLCPKYLRAVQAYANNPNNPGP
jgi:hypothetical protein